MKPMNRANRDDDFVTGYMCMIDFECELGSAMEGNTVYPSIEDLKEHHKPWESCGIVEVKVQYVRTIVEQNHNLGG
jgi:hypothetical protein